jgi:hypothetical protein
MIRQRIRAGLRRAVEAGKQLGQSHVKNASRVNYGIVHQPLLLETLAAVGSSGGWRMRQPIWRSRREYAFASRPLRTIGTIRSGARFRQSDLDSANIYVGPGGVRVGPGHHYYNRYEGGRCGELRQACLHKGQLGEEGMGNCQRYRAICR